MPLHREKIRAVLGALPRPVLVVLGRYTVVFTYTFDMVVITPSIVLAGILLQPRKLLGYLIAPVLMPLEAVDRFGVLPKESWLPSFCKAEKARGRRHPRPPGERDFEGARATYAAKGRQPYAILESETKCMISKPPKVF